MNVLCVDGPARGEVRDVEPAREIEVRNEEGVLSLYKIHDFTVLNHILRIASVYAKVDELLLDATFDLIASDLAREVVIE